METKDTMEIEKKIYTSPELVEHGSLVKMTQGTQNDQISDFKGSGSLFAPMIPPPEQ